MKYPVDDDKRSDLNVRFSHHPPKDDQGSRYITIRSQAGALATVIVMNTPPSREQSLALTKLEESVMWSNAAIARNE